jgi:hypothetical protein
LNALWALYSSTINPAVGEIGQASFIVADEYPNVTRVLVDQTLAIAHPYFMRRPIVGRVKSNRNVTICRERCRSHVEMTAQLADLTRRAVLTVTAI